MYRARDQCILVQGPMPSETVVLVSVGFQDPTQMRLATDNCVIETLATDRRERVLQRSFAMAWGLGRMRTFHG
jgi:hypothetical protein